MGNIASLVVGSMNKFIVLVLCLLPVCGYSQSRVEVFLSPLDSGLRSYLAGKPGVEFHADSLSVSNEAASLVLLRVLKFYKVCIELNFENLLNESTTRTPLGGPYLRQYATIDPAGMIQVLEDKDSSPRLVYDPTHPDAARSGKLNGYVAFPAVVRSQERQDLYDKILAYNSFVKALSVLKSPTVAAEESFSDRLAALGDQTTAVNVLITATRLEKRLSDARAALGDLQPGKEEDSPVLNKLLGWTKELDLALENLRRLKENLHNPRLSPIELDEIVETLSDLDAELDDLGQQLVVSLRAE